MISSSSSGDSPSADVTNLRMHGNPVAPSPQQTLTPAHFHHRELILLTGRSGVGKGVQGEVLSRYLNAPVRHVGRYVRTLDLPADLRERYDEVRARGDLLPDVTEQFLSALALDQSRIIILDGFPRDPTQARALIEYAAQRRWRLRVLALDFSENAEQNSITRQISRYAETHGEQPGPDAMRQIIAKARR